MIQRNELIDALGVRFVAGFALLSACLLGLYYFPYASEGLVRRGLDAYLHGYASAAGAILRSFEPSVAVTGPVIAGRYSLRIVRTCDAMDVTILLVAALLSWPGRWKRRVAAAAAGAIVLFAINIVRICSLYYVGVYFPASFELAHLEVWPAVILLATMGLFFALSRWERSA